MNHEASWFVDHLFQGDGFNPEMFEASAALYQCDLSYPLVELVVFGRPKPASFSKAQLSDAILQACRTAGFHPAVWWFHVNLHDNIALVVEDVGEYSFRSPLEPLMTLMERRPAGEGGTTYAGLLDREKRWCLLLEYHNGFGISVHGPSGFCAEVQHLLAGPAFTSERIRSATIEDAEPVGRLVTELGYPTTTAEMADRLAAILDDPNYATFVAVQNASVIGVAGAALSRYYEKDGVYSRLTVLAVSSTAHGQGIGRQLVEAVEHWSFGKGAREVFVNSGFHRGDAHGFYERCGYSRTGFRFVKALDKTDHR